MAVKVIQWMVLTATALIFLFSSSVEARIVVYFNSDEVSWSGYNKEIISDAQRALFHISDYEIKKCIYAHDGGWPTNIYLQSPTPWGDLYKSYEWSGIKRSVTISKADLQSSDMLVDVANIDCEIRLHNVIVCKFPWINVTFTATHTRKSDDVLNLGGKIQYKFSDDIPQSLSYLDDAKFEYIYKIASWKGTQLQQSLRSVQSSTVKIRSLKTKQRTIGTLVFKKIRLDLSITYCATLMGNIAANYEQKWKDHHFWFYDINEILVAGKQSLNISTEENIVAEFLRPYKIKIHIQDSKELLKEIYLHNTTLPDTVTIINANEANEDALSRLFDEKISFDYTQD